MLSQLGICRLSSAFYRWSSAFGLSCGRLGEAGVSAVRWSKWLLYLPWEVHVQYTHTYTYTYVHVHVHVHVVPDVPTGS